MLDRPAKVLPLRWGCLLALAISVSLISGVALMSRSGLAIGRDDWVDFVFLMAFFGMPFFVLALARTRDWLAWLLALGLTAGLWGYGLSRPYEGVNFLLGFIYLIAPFVISGLSLSLAGMRGRIPDWGEEGT